MPGLAAWRKCRCSDLLQKAGFQHEIARVHPAIDFVVAATDQPDTFDLGSLKEHRTCDDLAAQLRNAVEHEQSGPAVPGQVTTSPPLGFNGPLSKIQVPVFPGCQVLRPLSFESKGLLARSRKVVQTKD